jgi:hypothetical protein
MARKKDILIHLAQSEIRRKRPRKAKFVKKHHSTPNLAVPVVRDKRRKVSIHYNSNKRPKFEEFTRYQLIDKFTPPNLHHLLFSDDSPLNLKSVKNDVTARSIEGVVYMPDTFSLCENVDASIQTLRRIISVLFVEQNHLQALFDYSNCHNIGIEAQALMDVILSEFRKFGQKCFILKRHPAASTFPNGFGGQNILDEDVQKLMFSVGSPANLRIKNKDFEDVLKLPMRSHCTLTKNDWKRIVTQKEIDTTEIVDYVIACLSKMKKKLTPESLQNLSTVVGEILINAEEHSTFKHRFSMAYFQDRKNDGKHYGLLRFVILNLGATIYDNFNKNDKCPMTIIARMRALSQQYTKFKLFKEKEFDEETLWTLYALQQGVTSVPGKRRGSGTIQFIRSFFNIKGSSDVDNISKMVILSGNTEIIFDGKYGITERKDGKDKYNMMTFNKSGKIEDAPDSNYVRKSKHYFPGTIITASILLNEDDVNELIA